VTFSTAFPNSNVIITLGVRDRSGGRFLTDDCFPAVASVSAGGFTLQWRDLNGSACSVSASVTVNYIAVLVQ
jgi:hypothetical protein